MPRSDRPAFRPAHRASRRFGIRSRRQRGCAAALDLYAERHAAGARPGGEFARHSPIQRCRKKYEHARTLLGALQIPFAVIPANHHRRMPMRKIFPDPSYGPGDSALNSMRSVREVDIVLIDSTVPGAPHGELDAATLAWLESTLTANPTRSSTRASCIPTRPGYVMRTRWRRF